MVMVVLVFFFLFMGIPFFYTTMSGLPNMMLVTATAVILTGAGLLLASGDLPPLRRDIVRACALAVVAGVAVFQLALGGE